MIYPSVMAKSQQDLDKLLKKLSGVAKTLHLDIADGKAVPNKSLTFPFHLPQKFKYNAHLMMKHPEEWIRKHGHNVDICIPQFKEIKNHIKYIAWMRKRGKKIAFALNPETGVSKVRTYLKYCDYILILTVHPGFYGAHFLDYPLRKIAHLKRINPKIRVIVDGGMDPLTIQLAKKAGADDFVSGSYIAKASNPREAMKELKEVLRE